MRYMKRAAALVLALCLAAGLAAPALACEERVRAVVTAREGQGDRLWRELEDMDGVERLWRYEALFPGAAVEATRTALADIAALESVERVEKTAARELCAVESGPLIPSNSLDMMAAQETGLQGEGMVIAVIDTGLRWTHEAFVDSGQMGQAALSPEDVAAFAEEGGTPGRYISPRIPFAYDYCHGDDEVMTDDDHGTHVSALAVGYALAEDGTVRFRGVAPAAQLLAMKVFADGSSTRADDADVLLALEDALKLGADVVNLSLGSDNAFLADDGTAEAYRSAFRSMEEAGIVVCCAAGNAGYALMEQGLLPTTEYTDYGTLGRPAVYEETVAVAAADTAVYQDRGFLAAGDRRISFTPAVSSAGAELPELESLEGRGLEYVAVGGPGGAGDYAGLSLKGRVALVERGELSFEEKTRFAARAGAVACVVYNNADQPVTPQVERVDIPCVLISREDGQYLLEEGGGTLTVSGGLYLARRDRTEIQAASAWGTASDLRLSPTLTAPGGTVLSAGAESDSAYLQLSGTSMASPNAAGVFALVLQRLRQEGAENAGAQAQALLASTASLLRTEDGVPLSPRQQGAGLIDLQAALETDTWLREPLLSLGEVGAGGAVLEFRVENRGDEEMTYRISPTVLTEKWEQRDGVYISLLEPQDITDRCTVSGPETVTVPAGGSCRVQLTVRPEAELAALLEEVFPYGCFLEGYVEVTDTRGRQVHASFLAFRGDWEAAPVIEPTDFRHALAAERTLWEESGQTLEELSLTYEELLGGSMGANLVWRGGYDFDTVALLGDNPGLTEVYDPRRAAISGTESDAAYSEGPIFFLELYTLRNARRVIMVVSDEDTGQVYYVQERQWLERSGVNELLLAGEGSARFAWNGTGSGGQSLADGTRVRVDLYAWPESDSAADRAYESSGTREGQAQTYRWLRGFDRCRELSFSLSVDRSGPTAAVSADGDTAAVTVTDRQYTAFVQVRNSGGELLAEEFFAADGPGVSHTVTVETGEPVYITAGDYAGNLQGWCLQEGRLLPCAAAVLEDVALNGWYLDAVDRVWSEGIVESKSGRQFAPEGDATRAVLVKALHVLAGRPQPETWTMDFTDVEGGADYRQALLWAGEEGIVQGFTDTLFGGHASLSRQQLAVMLWRYAGQPDSGGDLTAFPDGADGAVWAGQALAWAVEQGYLTGYADGTLRPDGPLSRAELAVVLDRVPEDLSGGRE